MTNQVLPPSPIPPRLSSTTSVEEATKDAIYELINVQRDQLKNIKAIQQNVGCLFYMVLASALLGAAGAACAVMSWLGS